MSEGYIPRQRDDRCRPGTGGHGSALTRGWLAEFNSKLNDYIRRRGMRTEMEVQASERMARRNAERRARK